MSLHKLWLQIAALLSPHLPALPVRLKGSNLAQAKTWIHSKAFVVSKDKDGRRQRTSGVRPYMLHTQMSLNKLWVVNHSLGSTSDSRFASAAAGLRSGLGQNVDPLQGLCGQ